MTSEGKGEQPRQNTSYLNPMDKTGPKVGGFYLENHPNDRSQGAGLADETGTRNALNDPEIQPFAGSQLHGAPAAEGHGSPESNP